MPRKRFSMLAVFGAALLSSFLMLAMFLSYSQSYLSYPSETPSIPARTSHVLLGLPSARFRDNLRNDTLYITSFVGDIGWTNQVMAFGNLLYLALLTRRVPILLPFEPSHVGLDAPYVPFGEVFDIPRLASTMNIPILEWNQLKLDGNMTEDEPLGCWSVWATMHKEGVRAHEPRMTLNANHARVDISYTPVPEWVANGEFEHASFWKLARLGYPETRAQSLMDSLPSSRLGARLPPDEHLLCYDFLYYVSIDEPFDYEREYSPAWHAVVKHARWTPRLANIANEYMRATFGLLDGADIPPFISIHARHGDFKAQCPDLPLDRCFTPLAVWKKHVDVLRAELREQKGVDVVHVVMLSDEQDDSWWAEIVKMGWYRVDHVKMRTEETYGKWYPVFIDVVIQSAGKGFLGTETSTLSLLSMRRTQDWNDGIGKMITWNKHNEHPEAVEV